VSTQDSTVRSDAAQRRIARAPLVAIVYYVIVGVTAGAIGILNVVGAVSAAGSGCRLVFSQDAPELQGDPTAGSWSCVQYIDAAGMLLAFAVAAVLLITVRRLAGGPAGWGAWVAVSLVIGIVLGAAPLLFMVWAMDFYRLTPGPIELAIAVLPLTWAVASAFLVWRRARHAMRTA